MADLLINAGSGQRRFPPPWINLDIQDKHPPDVRADMFQMPFPDGSAACIVSHHTLEHLGCGEGAGFIREAHRILKSGGVLAVSVPDIRRLCQRWMYGQLTDYLFFANVYGAYQGDESDRHRWGFSVDSLKSLILGDGDWSRISRTDRPQLPGAEIASDWWIMTMIAEKR